MTAQDRREKMSLERAYEIYCTTIKVESSVELHAIAEALKTVQNGLTAASGGGVRLTDRLWYRIRQALFDKLLTNYSNDLEAFDSEGSPVRFGEPIPHEGLFNIRPEGLRRLDDRFEIPILDLHEMTVIKVSKVWDLHGCRLNKDHFVDLHIECSGACMMPPGIVFGHERLREETRNGRKLAYTEWWDLYWRAYCTPDADELANVRERMSMLESVWGDLSKECAADVA